MERTEEEERQDKIINKRRLNENAFVSLAISLQTKKEKEARIVFAFFPHHLASLICLFFALTSCSAAPLIMQPDFPQKGQEQLLYYQKMYCIIKVDR